MRSMEEYRHLRVYQASLVLLRIVAPLARRFSREDEKLRKQLDDAADGIGSNIAEGCGRKNKRHANTELIRYLHMSFAEANEVQHRIETALIRTLVSKREYWNVHNRAQLIKKMLRSWIERLENEDRGRISE
jgi:four helix bundle protein